MNRMEPHRTTTFAQQKCSKTEVLIKRDKLKKLPLFVRPVVANGKRVGLTDVDESQGFQCCAR